MDLRALREKVFKDLETKLSACPEARYRLQAGASPERDSASLRNRKLKVDYHAHGEYLSSKMVQCDLSPAQRIDVQGHPPERASELWYRLRRCNRCT